MGIYLEYTHVVLRPVATKYTYRDHLRHQSFDVRPTFFLDLILVEVCAKPWVMGRGELGQVDVQNGLSQELESHESKTGQS